MGYFPNGTSAEIFEAQFCERCVNYTPEKGGCPIMGLHFDWNYDACNGENAPPESPKHIKWIALENFIKRGKGSEPDRCTMFHQGESLQLPDPIEEQRKLKEWNELYGKKTERPAG